jgi:deazaflavin-dependent oxidoreductase (nitroreductase family)
MYIMAEYIPPTLGWVRKQVELYEGSGGTEGSTLLDTGMPCIIVTHTGNKTGGIRKIPLMRVKVKDGYVLIGSMGGQPKNPSWVYNLRADPVVQIRDKTELTDMRVREVSEDEERDFLWQESAKAYPPYNDYQSKTTRKIPVFIAEPLT